MHGGKLCRLRRMIVWTCVSAFPLILVCLHPSHCLSLLVSKACLWARRDVKGRVELDDALDELRNDGFGTEGSN